MKKVNYPGRKKFIQTEKKLEKKHHRIIIGLMIFAIAYYYFIEPKTIGHDKRYSLYIFWLPTVIGIIVLAFYRRQFLLNRFATNKGFVLWAFMICFYLIQGIIFSYLSFGQLAKVSWDYLNSQAVHRNPEEYFNCPITRFWRGKNPSVDFQFSGRHERFKVQYSTIKDYENKNDYFLKINATKGIWNYYTVNEWSIEKK